MPRTPGRVRRTTLNHGPLRNEYFSLKAPDVFGLYSRSPMSLLERK